MIASQIGVKFRYLEKEFANNEKLYNSLEEIDEDVRIILTQQLEVIATSQEKIRKTLLEYVGRKQ